MTTSIQGPTALSRSVSPFHGCQSPLEGILPSTRGSGGERRREVVEQYFAVGVARLRHRVPLRHPVEGVVP